MERFVAKQNIEHFKEMLTVEADPGRRSLLERMIAEEEAKLAGHIDQGPSKADKASA